MFMLQIEYKNKHIDVNLSNFASIYVHIFCIFILFFVFSVFALSAPLNIFFFLPQITGIFYYLFVVILL